MKRIQVTLTGNESKCLLARAAPHHPLVARTLAGGRLVLLGGTTVSALAEELGCGPMRISGRFAASGARTARERRPSPHTLLLEGGHATNIDDTLREVVAGLGREDLLVVGANAIDPQGRAGLAFAALGGGGRGYALQDAQLQGVPLLILCGLNKLVPDLAAAFAACGRAGVDLSMGAAVGLYPLQGDLLTETAAFGLLFGLEAVAVAGSGIGDGEGSRSFVVSGPDEAVMECWRLVLDLKGATLSGDPASLTTCRRGCPSCARHQCCAYKAGLIAEP